MFSEGPRPPPSGCCPKEYMDHCCLEAGDREKVQSCETGVPIVPKLTGLLLDRTACTHSWRTQACAGGYYLNVTTQKPQPCPPGMRK